jgi:hypothetical protein
VNPFEHIKMPKCPKTDTAETWLWLVKNTDRRTLPLTNDLTHMMVDHQNRQPEGYPYVFVPSARYGYIQNDLRAKGNWTYLHSRLKIINNFGRDFGRILARVVSSTICDEQPSAIGLPRASASTKS